MRKLIWLLGIVTTIATLSLIGCNADNGSDSEDCFYCEDSLGNVTKYCYNGLAHTYSVQINSGSPTTLPLIYRSWEEFKEDNSSCTIEPDCFNCEADSVITKYCYIDGQDYYTITGADSISTVARLNGMTWDEVKASILEECSIIADPECFDCTVDSVTTTYCYTEGDDYYTGSVDGQETEYPLDGMTWDQKQEELQASCDEFIEECFDCASADGITTYCYASANDFYTSTTNGETMEVPLNGQDWDTLKAELEANCMEDCFDCTVNGVASTFCYNVGDDFYTVTVGSESTQMPLGTQTWAEFKEATQAQCQ